MQALKCDRCNKYYDRYDSGKPNTIKLVNTDLYDNVATIIVYDLCKDCMAQLVTFLKCDIQI
jgi:hypothetical protein